MSIQVRIDGVAAEQLEPYRRLLGTLGPVPDESQRSIDLWTRSPQPRAGAVPVWVNPQNGAARNDRTDDWIKAVGAILQSRAVNGHMEDGLRERGRNVTVGSRAIDTPLDPVVLAAFLAHDFPLVDAVMLARAFREDGWPNDLADYPTPMHTPACDAPFPGFPRNAGLYAVVPSSDWVRRLAQSGVPVLQLRDKQQDRAARERNISESIKAVEGTGTELFINDHWQLAIQLGAYGVHLGQEDIETADLAAIRNAGLRLGISTHGIYEMLRAHACRPSYMALGAIYPTATKEMPTAPQGLRRLKHYLRLMSLHYPLVAIGGIDRSRIENVWATGVDCVAVLRAIVDAPDYRSAAAELLEMTPQMNCATGAA